MKPVEFEQQDLLLNPPKDMQRGACGALPIQVVDGTMQSYWKPDAADLEALKNGGHVRLCIHGHAHPPVWVDVTPKNYARELP